MTRWHLLNESLQNAPGRHIDSSQPRQDTEAFAQTACYWDEVASGVLGRILQRLIALPTDHLTGCRVVPKAPFFW
jgi:hypothetical protein